MTTDDRVEKIGMAIELARDLIDKGTPEGQDLSPEYDYAMRAPLHALAHSGIENGLKALIWQGDMQHPRGHHLGKLFQNLKGKASIKAKNLEDAFSDMVNFYTIDLERWVHFRTLDAYFEEYGSDKRYETFRYWALDDKDLYHIPLFVHRELLVVLSEWCRWGNKQFTSQRVNEALRCTFNGATERHILGNLDTIPCTRCNLDTQESRLRWRKTYTPATTPLDTLKHAYNCNFKIADDKCVNQVISDVFGRVKESKDPAVRYYVQTLYDLPEGSVLRPSGVELEVEWSAPGFFGIVRIRNVERLGSIRYSIDSRWCAQVYLFPLKIQFAKTKADAMNWLANECTEVVEVSVDRGPYVPRRAVSPVSSNRTRSGDGPWSPYKVIFADHAHGLSIGQHIKVRDCSPITMKIAEGIISRASGGLVEFGDEVP